MQAIVARAYAAIARPETLVDLIHILTDAEDDLLDRPEQAEIHFGNAASILGRVYPLSASEAGVLNTAESSAYAGDLILDGDLRVLGYSERMFNHTMPETGVYAPDWLFSPVSRNADRKRLTAFDSADDGTFIRLFTGPQDDAGRLFEVRLLSGENDTQVVLTLNAVRLRWSAKTGAAFRKALQLTETEIALVEHIVTGGKVRDFAEQRGRSIGTARNQLKTLQRKLSINSQEQLLLLYAGFVHSLASPDHGANVAAHQCDNIFEDGDRQTIAWEEFGDPKGTPVLFFHALEGALVTPQVSQAATQAGLRIVAPWRPHFGDTSGLQSGNAFERTHNFALRIPAFLDHLEIERVVALGTQAGMPYLMAMAQAHPERLHGVIGAGPFLPVAGKDFRYLAKSHRAQMRIARIAPSFVRIYQRAMLATMGTGEFYRFVEEYYQDCPRELDAVRRPELLDVFRRAATYAMRAEFEGTIDTMLTWSADWRELCRDIAVPVHMMVGAQDANCDPEFAALSCKRYDWPDAEIIEDAGSFLINDQTELVMNRVAEMFRDQALGDRSE